MNTGSSGSGGRLIEALARSQSQFGRHLDRGHTVECHEYQDRVPEVLDLLLAEMDPDSALREVISVLRACPACYASISDIVHDSGVGLPDWWTGRTWVQRIPEALFRLFERAVGLLDVSTPATALAMRSARSHDRNQVTAVSTRPGEDLKVIVQGGRKGVHARVWLLAADEREIVSATRLFPPEGVSTTESGYLAPHETVQVVFRETAEPPGGPRLIVAISCDSAEALKTLDQMRKPREEEFLRTLDTVARHRNGGIHVDCFRLESTP